MIAIPALDLTGRVALLTGASSGIGARWARLLAAAGASVVLCARRADALQNLVDEISAAGGKAIAVATDVASEASIIAAYDAAEAAFGTVDTIIANAGVSGDTPALKQSAEEMDQTIGINLRGVMLTAREGARRLIASGSPDHERGRIVITCSITAFDVNPGLAIYSATKAGVMQLGKVLAREWIRKGINVNMICPGWIRTEINEEWFDTEAGQRQIEGFNRRRLSLDSDLDVPLLWLCSDLSRGVTGSSVVIDDGQTL
ncbi:SDR family oxidoreductase [Sphingobium sp. Sx8-8]|uniref:SDR family NAD(P)-dependent oxidoreductase n=1 Tax=Sphingobium sp. Sx8-8 TaxID=2933617 RepID=UPI001F5858E5|nr:SDR family oxidoreductase [Sphingobium sp. Sx8-8]